MNETALNTFRHARREARIVFLAWLVALIWTVGYCYINGYQHDADNPLVRAGIADENPPALSQTRLGMPMWVCWGIFAPAIGCSLFTLGFGMIGISDDPLGVEKEEEQK
jgi:hypothetical protein